MNYPRDLAGYAGSPPNPHWPDNAQIAVSVVLNYEEGGEYNILHGDAHSEYVLTDVGGEPLPNARNLNVESNFEYGSRVGFWEIMRILRHRRVPTTVYAVGMALERNPAAVAEITDSGFEVACHGYRWIDYQSVPEDIERADIGRNVDVITRLIGKRPVGVANHLFNLNLNWRTSWVKGFALDAGLTIRGPMPATTDNSLFIEGRKLVSLGARYSFKLGGRSVTARIQATNLLGEYGLVTAGPGIYRTNQPRSVNGFVAIDF